MTEDTSADLEDLVAHLKRSRGFDFSGYKRPSLSRRIDKRLKAVHVGDYEQYIEYLETHPNEYEALFDAILINVTAFFRDPANWSYLRDGVLPEHIGRLPPGTPIRVWSAGCSSGEEAYSLAIALCELLGDEEFRRRVKIYGTDVDELALNAARQATYSESAVTAVPDDLRERYFERGVRGFTFRADLRRSVIFGRLDVVNDAPISRLELLSCRNTLMYFNAETQARVLDRFHFALNDEGVLFLGKAETLLSQNPLFEPIDRKRRIFRKSGSRRRDAAATTFGFDEPRSEPIGRTLDPSALDAIPTAALVIDVDGYLAHANERARNDLGLTRRDHRRLFQDLEVSYRPVELRGPIEQAYETRRPVTLPEVEWTPPGEPAQVLEVSIVPLLDRGEPIGAAIVFADNTRPRRLEDQLRHINQELEQAYNEVQSTNEELETTNEELQSTIEELETTNEELQSSNEELETMNEELQSTNDELQAVNDEIRMRSDELDRANQFLETILTSLRGGVIVVDVDRRIRAWNTKAEDLWGLREEEVQEQDLLTVDIGFPVSELARPLERCLSDGGDITSIEADAVTRRGRTIRCRVTLTPLREDSQVNGAIVVMEPAETVGAATN
jgi:two-component system CheB/CheR fusion protein